MSLFGSQNYVVSQYDGGRKYYYWFPNKSELHTKIVAIIEQLGWNLQLDRKANTLSIAEQQLVEIIRGLLRNAKILILDEPTSSLTFNEVGLYFISLVI